MTHLLDEDTQGGYGELLAYIRLLVDGQLPNAIQVKVTSPVEVWCGPGRCLRYPPPADAWRNDTSFREWVKIRAEDQQRQCLAGNKRFNVLRFLNAICEYDEGYWSFAEWFDREVGLDRRAPGSWLRNQLEDANPTQIRP